jgi:hypothetical protein
MSTQALSGVWLLQYIGRIRSHADEADGIASCLEPHGGACMKQGKLVVSGVNRRRVEKTQGRKVPGEANLG